MTNLQPIKKIGILTAGQVRDDLVERHGEYPDMFKRLLITADPHIETVAYRVYDAEYPTHIDDNDAYVISGSRYAVYDPDPWIRRLEDYVRQLYAARKPTVGICFGHQMMARALGGVTEKAPQGWGIGKHIATITEPRGWMNPAAPAYGVFVSHQDQVIRLPPPAERLATNAHCPNAMFVIDDFFLGIQGHPEFTGEFAHDLAAGRIETYGEETFARALPTYRETVDSPLIARWILRFLAAANATRRRGK
jgi:GMP synthase-like glutamine amidotransferase